MTCVTHTPCGGALFCWLSQVCWHPPSPICWAGEEIWQQTGGQLDAFVSGAGTGGTIAGVSLQLKSHNPAVKVVLADPQGSSLFNKVSVITLRASKIYGSIKPGDEQILLAYSSSCGAPPDMNLTKVLAGVICIGCLVRFLAVGQAAHNSFLVFYCIPPAKSLPPITVSLLHCHCNTQQVVVCLPLFFR